MGIRQPPAFPCRLQHSIIGRLGLNLRVRDGNGCVPQAHHHRNPSSVFKVLSASRLTRSPLSSFPLLFPLKTQQYIKPLLIPLLLGLIQLLSQPTFLSSFLRKEVIQPHLPIRLPCYDFTPVIGPAFGSSLLPVGSLTSGVTDSHGVTGGVYKTRERIHRGILIRDY